MSAALETSAIVALIGAGAMGAGIAQIAGGAGHAVLLFDVYPAAAPRARMCITGGQENLVTRGKRRKNAVDAAIGRITPVNTLADLAPVHLARL